MPYLKWHNLLTYNIEVPLEFLVWTPSSNSTLDHAPFSLILFLVDLGTCLALFAMSELCTTYNLRFKVDFYMSAPFFIALTIGYARICYVVVFKTNLSKNSVFFRLVALQALFVSLVLCDGYRLGGRDLNQSDLTWWATVRLGYALPAKLLMLNFISLFV